jgi:hypothetical protein
VYGVGKSSRAVRALTLVCPSCNSVRKSLTVSSLFMAFTVLGDCAIARNFRRLLKLF